MFKLIKQDGRARRGELTTPHGIVQTPVFMNVGTQAAIKGALSSEDLRAAGCQIELSNTYHLHVRPGDMLIRSLGGLHKFMSWNGPIITDSGGFQIFSLAGLRKITEEGVNFACHIDGHKIFISPEISMQIQSNLGSDIVMAFDECVKIPSPREYVKASIDRTTRWLMRCKTELSKLHSTQNALPQMLFGINQGAVFPDLRIQHMEQIAELELDGYALGGLAVGETEPEMYEIIDITEPHMPYEKPRYLMGVGTPRNIVESVHRGIDMFDCVMPSRNGRHGKLFAGTSAINIRNLTHKDSTLPIDEGCSCPVCRNYTRAYLRHLFVAGEMLAMRLAVMHNLWYYNELMSVVRECIERGALNRLRDAFKEGDIQNNWRLIPGAMSHNSI